MYKRSGIDVFRLCGCIFAAVGSFFCVIAVFITFNMDYVAAHGEGDVWILNFIFGVMGGLSATIGFFLIAESRKKRKLKERLIEQGDCIFAEIVGSVADFSIRINGWPTYKLKCCYTDPLTKIVHVFYSENLPTDPAAMVAQNTVRVYVDRESEYHDYYVAVNDLVWQR